MILQFPGMYGELIQGYCYNRFH